MKRIMLYLLAIAMLTCCQRSEKQYQAIVETLDITAPLELENIIRAHDMISSTKNLTHEQIDDLLERFTVYVLACADVQSSLMEEAYGTALATPNASEAERLTDSLQTAMNELRQYGIIMYASEGGINCEIMPIYIVGAFWEYLTPSERALAELNEIEVESPSMSDAALIVTYDEIAQRLKHCDDLMAIYADDQLLPHIEACQKYYLSMLLVGADNAPVFDWETGRLMPQIHMTLETYIEEYPEAASTPALKQFLEMAAQSDYKNSDALQIYVQQLLDF